MIRVRRCDPPAITPQTVALVSNALVPVLGWRDVPVLHEVRQELTALERFVLEMALELETVTAEDFAELVSLPRQVLAAGATRLIAGRALHLYGDAYQVAPEIAERALRDKGIRRPRPATADFVLLPRTGDVLVLPPAKKSWLRQLELARVAPASAAPVPADLCERRRSGYLAERVRAGTAALLDPSVVDVPVPDGDPPLVAVGGNGAAAEIGLCAAYNCRAEVQLDERGGRTVRAVLHGKARRRGKSGSEPAVEVAVQLTGADGLVDEWLALTGELADPGTQRAAWPKICPRVSGEPPDGVRRRGPVEWEFPLTEPAARAIAGEGRPLDRPFGLTLDNGTAAVQVLGWFVPDDDGARLLYARDQIVGRLLTATDAAAELASVCEGAAGELGVSPDLLAPQAIRDRAWELSYYPLVYALREPEDFPYD